jgi:hypothetical protein
MTELVRVAPTPFRRYWHGAMLIEQGDLDQGLAALGALAGDVHAPRELRVNALRTAGGGAVKAERWDALPLLCRSWLELAPDETLAKWTLVDALRELGLTHEASAAYDDLLPEPSTPWELQAAAKFFAATLAPAVAAQRIIEITADAAITDPEITRILRELDSHKLGGG